MNPINLPFDVTQFIPDIIHTIMISSVAIAVAGFALAFFSANNLAMVGFSLLGVCSVIGFFLIEEAEELNQLAQIQQEETAAIQNLKEITIDLKTNTSTISKTNQLFRFFFKKAPKLIKKINDVNIQVTKTLTRAPSTEQIERLKTALARAQEKIRLEQL